MPVQDLASAFVDSHAPQRARHTHNSFQRLIVFMTAALVGTIGTAVLLHSFRVDGTLHIFEMVLSMTTAFLLAWESLAATTAILGYLTKAPTRMPDAKTDMRVAILLPLYGEDAASAIGNANTLLRSLSMQARHRFSLHILSDTRNAALVDIEREVSVSAQYKFPFLDIFYHHRQDNTDYKAGNIKAWIERDGAAHDAVLVLDADSVMTSKAVLQMIDQLAGDASCGLVQTLPEIAHASNFWQWTQSFATATYGQVLGNGMGSVMGDEGNYYGHNAIFRTKAFAACAGLPRLQISDEVQESIMSHDFVEAALLRRAGWSVRFAPQIEGSYESTPLTLMGFIARDARWCFGNLQHLRLLTAAGLHPFSRWHLFHGAMTYLTSIFWLITLVSWTSIGQGTPASNNSLPFVLPLAVVIVVLLPKLVGFFSQLAKTSNRQKFFPLAGHFLMELLASTFVAPTLMVHRLLAIMRYATGVRCEWPEKSESIPTLGKALRFHVVEIIAGAACVVLVGVGTLSMYMMPVALCLLMSPLFSYTTSIQSKSTFRFD
jgi:membrane glycosyltransferase